jgi:hypothetical protein
MFIMKDKIATTVKIEPTLYDEFKVLGIRCRLTLQGLVERCVYRYVKEDVFRTDINNFTMPVTSGSVATV